MTREEKLQKAHQMFDNRNLLTELKWQREYFKKGYISSREELFNLWIFDECIKALQEPCEDAVSREFLLLDLLLKAQGEKDVSIKWLEEYINSLPSVTPQPKTGHWIEEFNDLEGEVRFTCSSCGKYQPFGTDYCYNCGAKMVDPQESEVKE